MKRFISLAFFLLCCMSLTASTNLADSLQKSLSAQKEDTNKVNILNDLAWEFRWIDLKRAEHYAQKAKSLSEKLSFERGRITSLCRIGSVQIDKGELKTAESTYLTVLKAEKKMGYVYGIGRAQNQLGEIYRSKEEYQKAVKYTKQAIKSFNSIGNNGIVALCYNKLGSIYESLGEYDLSLSYLLKGLKIRKQLGDQFGEANSHLSIGVFYISIQSYPEATHHLKQAEETFRNLNNERQLAKAYFNIGLVHYRLYDFNTSLDYYNRSLNLKRKFGLHKTNPLLYNNIGAVYFKKGNFEKAIEYYLKSCEIQENSDEGITLPECYKNLGDIYLEKNQYQKAIEYYLIALKKTKEAHKKTIEVLILKNLSECYRILGDHEKANTFNKQYISINDSLEKNYRNAISLHNAYVKEVNTTKLLRKDAVIQKSKLESVESKNKSQRILILSLIIGIILLTVLFFTIFRAKKQRQQASVKQKRIEELLKNQELKSLSAMIEGQEEERQRIAKDLHDGLGSKLSMVKISFDLVENQLEQIKESVMNEYSKAHNLLDDACDEVRKIAHNMASGTLDKFGLAAAVQDLCDTVGDMGKLHIDFNAHGLEERIDRSTEIDLYRVIQELISNSLKYSSANELTVQIIRSKDNLNLIVEDNGIGFDTSKERSGMGLKNVLARTDKLNGTVHIDSTLGIGTSISLDIPIKQNK